MSGKSPRVRTFRNALLLAAWCLMAAEVWGGHEPAPKDVTVAERFVDALNRNDVHALVLASACPFVFRNQEWESAKDGSGFVHGKADDKSIESKQELDTFFVNLVSKVKIENGKAATNPPSKESLLGDNLKEAPAAWKKLDLFVFGRGFGDVEHVAIVGVDPAKHKVQGLYLN